MRIGQLVQRRDQHGMVVSLTDPAWPGCVHVEWPDGRREWVPRTQLQARTSRIRA